MRSHEEVEHGDLEKTFLDCLMTFEKRRLDSQKGDILDQIKAAEITGDRDLVKTLMAEYNALSRKKAAGETVRKS